jgi:uncharacterized protein
MGTTSKYNYIIDRGELSYWYNGVMHSSFVLQKGLSQRLQKQMKNIEVLKQNAPKFYKNLQDNGFIVDEAQNELDIIREKHQATVDNRNYYLIVLPTLDCNFKCWYCIQEHIHAVMDSFTIAKLKKHLEKMVFEEKIESLHIEWFGGEPFMYFNDVIKPISQFAIELCEKANIPFYHSATTNAYYLKKEIQPELLLLKLNRFQITLDGARELHNRVKNAEDGTSSFDLSLQHINEILSLSHDASILLRINYSDATFSKQLVEQINSIIHIDNRARIQILFRKIWQEKASKVRTNILQDYMEMFKHFGYHIHSMDLNENFISCYTSRKFYNSVNYNGDVLKCTANNDMYSSTPPGRLQEDGTIVWRENFLETFYQPRFENKTCLKCKYLPLCMGECNLNYGTSFDKPKCRLANYDMSFEDQIVYHIQNIY